MSVFDFYAWFGSRLEFVATTIGIAWVAVYGIALAFGRQPVPAPDGGLAGGGLAAHRPEEVVR